MSRIRPPPPHREPPWMSLLNDKQKTEIKQLMDSLRATGPEKVRDAIGAKLREWGINVPRPPQQRKPPPRRRQPEPARGRR